MSDATSQSRMDNDENDDAIDLISLFLVIWKRRKLIVLGTLGITFLAAIVSVMLPKVYLSTGFYQLGVGGVPLGIGGAPVSSFFLIEKDQFSPFVKNGNELSKPSFENSADLRKSTVKNGNELSIPSFKSSSVRFYNPERLKFFADYKIMPDIWEKISVSFKNSEDIRKRIKPIYAHSKEDARETGGSLPTDQKNVVIGVELSYESDSPQHAQNIVSFLGEYVKDCLRYDHLFYYIQNGFNTAEIELNKIDNLIMDYHFMISQYTNKVIDIQTILTKYPDSARTEDRQVVSVQEGGYHYLSPVSQLVGIESKLADLRSELAETQRIKEKLVISRTYFSICKDLLEKADSSGNFLLSQLVVIKSELLKDLNSEQDTTKESINHVSLDIQRFMNLYANYRFISGPSIPEKHIKPNKRVIVMVTFFASFFVLIMVSFFIEWWQNSKKIIQTSNLQQLKE
jgi:hypothetical protein